VIELIDISKVYGSGSNPIAALDGISLRVARAEISAIVGPSGSGKSTLARCVNMLERPTSGSVIVDGEDLTARTESQLRRSRRAIGTVFQASSLLRRRTAAENISLPLEYVGADRRERQRRVAELLERVDLGDRADHYPHQLSGGQRQRVGIARALALQPSVLLADEATSGLDPETTASILNLLRELRNELDLTIVLITHEMDVVRRAADSAAWLQAGKVVESGSVVGLVTDPTSQLGAVLLPAPAHIDPQPGEEVWHVVYDADQPAPDWISRLAGVLDSPVSLLGASIEPIGGRAVGRATIGLQANSQEQTRSLLAQWGLHAMPGAPGSPITAPSLVAAGAD
jgi:D-methionine transport system ATP-binding protein